MAQKAPTLMFVCDICGWRKALDRTKRHWCEACGQATEMRCVRDRKPPDPMANSQPRAF